MKLALAVVLLAACTEHGSRPHLDVNITSVPGTIKVYRPDADLCCTATEPFPDEGACVFSTDAVACQDCSTHPSCFTSFDLEGDLGSKLGVQTPGMANTLVFSAPFEQTELTLFARGCGDDIRIPIPQGGGPVPALTESTVTDGVDASWTTSHPAAGAIVSDGTRSCRTTATSHHFTSPEGIITVLTYDAPTVVESATATFTLYNGGFGSGEVPL